MSRRFFFQGPLTDAVEFDRALAHRLAKVLRLHAGNEVSLFDGSGEEARVRIDELTDTTGRGSVLQRYQGMPEPRTRVHLYQAIAKSDRFDWLVEKATEIGVAHIVPLIASRSVVRTHEGAGRVDRWRRIAIEAAEQCGRSAVPVVEEPQQLEHAIRSAPGVIIVPYEGAEGAAHDVPHALDADIDALFATSEVSIFVGPEGGFDPHEVLRAQELGASVATLGRRVLRSETAGVVAATLVLHATGDLG